MIRKPSSQNNQTNTIINLHVGKIKESTAVLLSEDFTMLEMPLNILPLDVRKGNILKFTIERNIAEEEARKDEIKEIQSNIMKNQKIFEDYYKKIEYFQQQQLKMLNFGVKTGPKVQKTIDQVLENLNNVKNDRQEEDKLKSKPKPVIESKIEKDSVNQ